MVTYKRLEFLERPKEELELITDNSCNKPKNSNRSNKNRSIEMLFEYYKDEIVLSEEAMNHEVTLLAFDKFMNASKPIIKEAGIPENSVTFFYKRNKKGVSVLGISMLEGNNEDLSNYLVYDCKPDVHDKKVYCNIDMHATAKTTDFALAFASRGADEVNAFFQEVETLIHRSGDPALEFDYMQQIELSKKKKGLLGKLFQKKKTRGI